jgi:hypothetical protein
MLYMAPPQPNSRPRFQFSLGWLFVITAFVAIATACGAAFDRRVGAKTSTEPVTASIRPVV